MTNKIIKSQIFSIISALKWQESRDGTICHVERDNALRIILGLLNKVENRERFAASRAILFRLMNEAKINLA